jgi:hypothetical protein
MCSEAGQEIIFNRENPEPLTLFSPSYSTRMSCQGIYLQLHEGLPRPKTCTHIENECTDEDEVPSDTKPLFAVWSEGG